MAGRVLVRATGTILAVRPAIGEVLVVLAVGASGQVLVALPGRRRAPGLGRRLWVLGRLERRTFRRGAAFVVRALKWRTCRCPYKKHTCRPNWKASCAPAPT